ncbi:BC1872 family protein [Oceanobacillus damuensis]|uniref:BC1872 family protein n=1 Tax=Oceanobacillus damuensis TaxID=937928 RepID=UPI001F3A2487|nr:hypothetical protein [Oceanobacillus damuensis]
MEIDKLVASKVLGIEIKYGNIVRDGKRSGIPSYSRSIEQAWKVVESLRNYRQFTLSDCIDENNKLVYYVNFQYNDTHHVVNYEAYSNSVAMAICLAALKSVGVEI